MLKTKWSNYLIREIVINTCGFLSQFTNNHTNRHVNVWEDVQTCVHVVCERKKEKEMVVAHVFMCSHMHISAK